MVGIAALACVSIFGLLSTIASSRMVDEVNEKLSKGNQFGQLGWYGPKPFDFIVSTTGSIQPVSFLERSVHFTPWRLPAC